MSQKDDIKGAFNNHCDSMNEYINEFVTDDDAKDDAIAKVEDLRTSLQTAIDTEYQE
jgi:hypothetical protein